MHHSERAAVGWRGGRRANRSAECLVFTVGSTAGLRYASALRWGSRRSFGSADSLKAER